MAGGLVRGGHARRLSRLRLARHRTLRVRGIRGDTQRDNAGAEHCNDGSIHSLFPAQSLMIQAEIIGEFVSPVVSGVRSAVATSGRARRGYVWQR
jgi:hypothetical protein